MKILILATVRTRSSYFIDMVCTHYKLNNIFEAYGPIERKVSEKNLFKYPEKLWPMYVEETMSLTNELKEMDNFAVKVFPGHWLNCWKYNYHYLKKTDWNLLPTDIMDIKITHNLSMYDKIFVLKRKNHADYFCSYISAKSRGKFLYRTSHTRQANIYKQKPKHLVYSQNDIKVSVIEKLGLEYATNFLKKENIPFVEIEYNDIPTYTSTNFPQGNSTLLDTGFNYKELISNYDQVEIDIENTLASIHFPKI